MEPMLNNAFQELSRPFNKINDESLSKEEYNKIVEEYWLGYSDSSHEKKNEQFSPWYMMGYKDQQDWTYYEYFSEEGYGLAYNGQPYDNPYDGEEGEAFKRGYESI